MATALISWLTSWLYITRTLSVQRTVHAPLSDVLAVIHDPVALVKCNALTVSSSPHPTQPGWIVVIDRLSVLGYLTTHSTYKFKHNVLERSARSEVDAGVYMKSINVLSAEESSGGTTVVTEVINVVV